MDLVAGAARVAGACARPGLAFGSRGFAGELFELAGHRSQVNLDRFLE